MKTFLLATLLAVSPLVAKAADYYSQFEFRVNGSCANRPRMWFHQAANWTRADLGRDAQGRIVYADIGIQLFPDGTYWMDYTEIAITSFDGHGGWSGVPLFHTTKEAQWGVYGPQLALGGFLTAMPQRIHSHGGEADGFVARFFNAVHDPRLLNVPVTFGAVESKAGPKGVTPQQFCRP